MKIKIYTDGACVGNPGPGGWAAIILIENEKRELKCIQNHIELHKNTRKNT